MVQGNAGAMWKGMAEKVTDPKLITLDVKPLGSSAAREIGTFSLKTKGTTPQEVGLGEGGERLEARNRHLERWKVDRSGSMWKCGDLPMLFVVFSVVSTHKGKRGIGPGHVPARWPSRLDNVAKPKSCGNVTADMANLRRC